MIARKHMVTIPVAASPIRENGMPMIKANAPTNETVTSMPAKDPVRPGASQTADSVKASF